METEHKKASAEQIQVFKNLLDRLGDINHESWEAFSQKLYYCKFKKGEYLTKVTEVESYIHFILNGAIRVFVPNDNKDVSTNFGFDNQFACSLTSFLTQKPSQYNIQTLLDSEFIKISHQDLYYLYDNFVDINKLGRVVMEQLLMHKRQKELDFLTLSAEERYQKLLMDFPKYVLELPLKHIASYLGITAESLSRIRSKKDV